MKTYNISLYVNKSEPQRMQVPGRLLTIANVPCIIHRPIDNSLQLSAVGWTVTDYKTGLAISHVWRGTRNKVIDEATTRLQSVTPEQFAELQAKNMARYGIAEPVNR